MPKTESQKIDRRMAAVDVADALSKYHDLDVDEDDVFDLVNELINRFGRAAQQ